MMVIICCNKDEVTKRLSVKTLLKQHHFNFQFMF